MNEINYCGFTTVEEIIKDHKWLKKDIKGRERQCDKIVDKLFGRALHNPEKLILIRDEIEQMAHDMGAINM